MLKDSPSKPIRAAWLCDYGMRRLPADLPAADLRLAATIVAKVAKSLPHETPGQQESVRKVKTSVLSLLDRAAKLVPGEE